MNKVSQTIPWVSVIAESANDYAAQALFADQMPVLMNKNDTSANNPTLLSGSFLMLTANEGQIELGFLANEPVLMDLARIILSVSPEDTVISQLDMMDAINEMINVISGGVKSRVNHQIPGGILLGIPYFLDGDVVKEKIKHATVETLDFAGMPVTLYVSEPSI
ncbi:chemotaxis protein CheX [Legionella worsleiensis]|uniref:Chemotaxis phosphatase CheX-like domain-containing protein n=1 Tax=Legionella worsleiensis TaxID=45076 RepID=A0A0W1A4A6_9GAMM|nr:chemotaxis protein CheX [Legionella worsleiensis]KTD76197.1 hypothetical protein Lwor_2315 [Legionella worsleiensis]STY33227.1 Uncharacterised protein [Legionella worsleiensis]